MLIINEDWFKECLISYSESCENTPWLNKSEIYKFRFTDWVLRNVDFATQSDEQILSLLIESQDQTYTDGSREKGINFIKSDLQYGPTFITLDDVKLIRSLNREAFITKEELSQFSVSAPKVSIWLSIFYPDKYKIYGQNEVATTASQLYETDNIPLTGHKAFLFATELLTDLESRIKGSPELDELVFKRCLNKDSLSEADWAWLTQDFCLFFLRNIAIKDQKGFLNKLCEKLQSEFKNDNHPLANHTWVKNNSNNYRQISIFPNEPITKKRGVHYEIYCYAKYITVEIHPEGTVKDNISFFNFFKDKVSSPYEFAKWYTSESFDNKKIRPKSYNTLISIKLNFDEVVRLMKKNFEDLYAYFNPLMEEHYKMSTPILNKFNMVPKNPLNQILYGPPGTGKTYNTINKAVSIIEGIDENDLERIPRKELKKRFDDYLINDWKDPKGQIGFVTFHQSMSYEDFIEGIKPSVNEKEVTYNIIRGIFRSICALANDNWLDAKKNSGLLPFEDAFNILKDEWEDNPEMKFPMKTEGKDFTILGFTDSSIQFKKSSGGTGHTLSKSTLRDYYYEIREIGPTGVGIYYPSVLEKLKSYKPSLSSASVKKKEKKFVLIIDEINRGNISQIFGELITLIEEGKRLGKDETLEVTLPYSKDVFGVPPNLYIVGTMNTADRSVEALDTALRRRFSFEEMIPKSSLLSHSAMICQLFWKYEELAWEDHIYKAKEEELFNFLGVSEDLKLRKEAIWKVMKQENDRTKFSYFDDFVFTGYNLKKILDVINKRIEILLDRDHTIGHSYFINISNEEGLKETFKRNIIPLLQEYFYHDYEKIGWVLGEGFIEELSEKKNDVFGSFYNAQHPDVETTYKIKNFESIDIIKAIEGLLGVKKTAKDPQLN